MKSVLKAIKILMTVFVCMLLTVWVSPSQALTVDSDQPQIYLARGGSGGGSGGGDSKGQGSPGMTGGFGQGSMQMERTREMEQTRDQDQVQDRDQDQAQDRDQDKGQDQDKDKDQDQDKDKDQDQDKDRDRIHQ